MPAFTDWITAVHAASLLKSKEDCGEGNEQIHQNASDESALKDKDRDVQLRGNVQVG